MVHHVDKKLSKIGVANKIVTCSFCASTLSVFCLWPGSHFIRHPVQLVPPVNWSFHSTGLPSQLVPSINWSSHSTGPLNQLAPSINWSPQSTGPPVIWSPQSTGPLSQLVPQSSGPLNQLVPPNNSKQSDIYGRLPF